MESAPTLVLGGIWKECFICLLSQVERRHLSVSNIVLHPEWKISCYPRRVQPALNWSNPDYWLRKGILGLETDLCKEHICTFQMLNISRRTINEVFREVTVLSHCSCITSRDREEERERKKTVSKFSFIHNGISHSLSSFLVMFSFCPCLPPPLRVILTSSSQNCSLADSSLALLLGSCQHSLIKS